MRKILAVSLVIAASATSTASAQLKRPRSPFADSSAGRIMAHAGRDAGELWLRDVLRQVHGAQASAKLDAIADSLAERAISAGRAAKDEAGLERAAAAIGALAMAGNTGLAEGVPYDGALTRLTRIADQSKMLAVRYRAIYDMLGVPGRPQALNVLRRVAVSSDPLAEHAVRALITDALRGSYGGPAPTAAEAERSARMLRDLASRRAVVYAPAALLLDRWRASR